jgi:hypothetical protein
MSDQSGTGATPSPDAGSTDTGATPIPSSMGTVVIPSPSQASATPTETPPTDAGGTRDADSDTGHDDDSRRDASLSPEDAKKALDASRRAERQARKELKRYQDEEQARNDANKTELERASERAAKAETRVAEMEREALARQVANESGIPTLWHRLTGTDVRTLRADAQRMREEMGMQSPTGMDGGVRSLGNPPQPSSMDDLIRQGARR